MSSPVGQKGGAGDERDAPTDLPFFKTWRAVYWFIFISFASIVGLLALFTFVFAA